MVTHATLVQLLRDRAAAEPERVGYVYLKDGHLDEQRMTYAQLDLRSRQIALRLQAAGARPGDRALICHLPGLDYIASFFGCLYAGVIAVPVYPPRFGQKLGRIDTIVTDVEARLALTSRAVAEALKPVLDEFPLLGQVQWLETDAEGLQGNANEWQDPGSSAATLAFLQFTSGSTSAPKGVMLTHGNLIANLEAIRQMFGSTAQSQGVIWLPPYHDMGLIGGILQPLYAQFPVTLMSPFGFLQRPVRWLQAISRYRGTISGGPNFAFELCVRRVTDEQLRELDLSSWDVAFCGAEPIRPEVLRAFYDKFRSTGLRREALYPCYGLAESTLMVTGAQKRGPVTAVVDGAVLEHQGRARRVELGAEHARELVSCGVPAPGHQVRVVDPGVARPLDVGMVGEIWVSGPSVAQGYWRKERETHETFEAILPELTLQSGSSPQQKYLRTGDLGFLLDGELYVTGRIKDMMIFRGRNVYPQDVEATSALAHSALKGGATAAFSIDDGGEERLVIVQEVDRREGRLEVLPEVEQAIRDRVHEEHGLSVHDIALVRSRSIPVTSSGKIQRQLARKAYQQGALESAYERSTRTRPSH